MTAREAVDAIGSDPVALDPARRRLLQASLAGAVTFAAGCGASVDAPGFDAPGVEDVAQMERVPVARELRPRNTDEIVAALSDWRGPVSIGGGRFSMGGQVVARDSLHLDMRGMCRVLWLDPVARTVRAQAGMTWRDLQDLIDPHDLSVAVMQSYSNFTLGGSVSVNCHGRYVGKGPLVNTLRALRLFTADGTSIELSRQTNAELFGAVVGGYGGLGVVTEVELDLDRNTRIERREEWVALADYPEFFRTRVLADPLAALHNADLAPPSFDRPLAVTWRVSERPVTDPMRLTPRDGSYGRDRALLWIASELVSGPSLRAWHQERERTGPQPVVWRNREASLDVASLEPASRDYSTYLLQEYFIPVDGFLHFAKRLAGILQAHDVNALNVSIRHSPADTTTLLRWAREDVFCFVLYHKQRNHADADRDAQRWTRALIDAALEIGGRYYLTYRLHATPSQFLRAYPDAVRFSQLKHGIDPTGRFRNRLWDAYLPGSRDA